MQIPSSLSIRISELNTIEFEHGTRWLRCVQGAPVPSGVTGAEMTDRRNPRSCVARTVEGPPTRPKERTTQTHPAHGTGSLQDTSTGGHRTHGQGLVLNRAFELDTELDHGADPEHVHGLEPVLMIGHRHTPAPARQGAPTGATGGRLDCALALGQRRTRVSDLDTELDHDADPGHDHRGHGGTRGPAEESAEPRVAQRARGRSTTTTAVFQAGGTHNAGKKVHEGSAQRPSVPRKRLRTRPDGHH